MGPFVAVDLPALRRGGVEGVWKVGTLHIRIKYMVHNKRYRSMDLLLELLQVLLHLLLYVFHHVHTRVPSCNARKRMKLPEKAGHKNYLRGIFEYIVLKELP